MREMRTFLFTLLPCMRVSSPLAFVALSIAYLILARLIALRSLLIHRHSLLVFAVWRDPPLTLAIERIEKSNIGPRQVELGS